MSLVEKVGKFDSKEIEPGKRLIKVGDEGGASLTEVLGRRLHRLVWKAPFQGLRLRGRFPLKLLAVPKDPIAGDKAIGEALTLGSLVHGSESHSADTLDFNDARFSTEYSDYLQSFAWLRDLAAATTRERGGRLAEQLVAKWVDTHAAQISDRAWRVDLWGKRILFWAAYAPYILGSKDLVYRSAVLNTLAKGARYLDKGADKAPAGLPRITAWTGVIAAALVVQGGPARLSRGEAGLSRALDAALHDDGGLISRSPIEQLALVELLAQLRAVYFSARRDMPDHFAETLAAATAALLAVALGDEALSSWQGGNMLTRRRVQAAVEGSGVTTRALRQARGWGYQRIAAKGSVAVFDAAPPPASRAFHGGCASTLAFELSDGANRLVVNCGGAAGASGKLPPELAQALRTTAAHSTLTLGDRNSTAIHDDGTLGKGVNQVEVSRDETGGRIFVEASHDGYQKRFGLVHLRKLELSSDGSELTGEDLLQPAGRKRKGATGFAVRFHLAPGVEVASTADGQGALLRIRGGNGWQFRCRGGRLDIEESLWIDGSGVPRGTQQLVIVGETPAEGMSIAWTFKRA
jgi:uncharacterized heparinase superfamily protein